MIFLGKEEVEKLVDPNEIMDQIERLTGSSGRMPTICRPAR